MLALPAALLALLAGLVLAGCGGSHRAATGTSTTTTTTTATTSTTTTAPTTTTRPKPPAPRGKLITIHVVDGDTGSPVTGASLRIRGARKHGPDTVVLLGHRAATLTLSAPSYTTRTVRVVSGDPRLLTLRLYRTAGQWLMYGVSAASTQSQGEIRLRPPFKIAWARDLGTLLEFPAVVDDGVAYLSNLSGHLFALRMDNGRTVWKFNMESHEQNSAPAIVGDRLVAHSKSGRVLVLDRANGHLLWSWTASGQIESSPVVEHGIDYLGDWAGDVYALDLKTHKVKWDYHDGCKITASATISGGTLYIGDYCGRIVALRRSTGAVLWSRSAGGVVYGTSAVAGGRVFVPSRGAEALYAFDTSGNYLWHVSTGGLVYSAPAVWHGRVYFGSYTGVLYCLSEATGQVLWDISTGGAISGSPTVIDGVVYAGNFAHRIVGADARTGHVLFTFPHGEYVAVSGNPGRLLLYGWASVWAVEARTRK